MKRQIFLAAMLILTLAFYTTASANLLQNGNFENTAADINGPEFTLGTSDTGEWYALSPWDVLVGGPTGSVYYFDHYGGGGGDQKAFQPIDTSGMLLSGTEVTLSLDYIFEDGNYAAEGMGIAVVGLSGAGAKYVAYGGSGYGGIFGTDPIGITRNVLGTLTLSQTTGWSSDSLTVTADQNYDALIAVIAASAWNLYSVNGGGIRGIDNVSLSGAPVPEPATMLLLGIGLIGLSGFSRKKFRKK